MNHNFNVDILCPYIGKGKRLTSEVGWPLGLKNYKIGLDFLFSVQLGPWPLLMLFERSQMFSSVYRALP